MNEFRDVRGEVWCPTCPTCRTPETTERYARVLGGEDPHVSPMDVAVAIVEQARFWLSIVFLVSDEGSEVEENDTLSSICAVAALYAPRDRPRLDDASELPIDDYNYKSLCHYFRLNAARDIESPCSLHGSMFTTSYPESRLDVANECESSCDSLVRVDMTRAAYTAQYGEHRSEPRRNDGAVQTRVRRPAFATVMRRMDRSASGPSVSSASEGPQERQDRPMAGLGTMVDVFYWRVMPLARAAVYRWVAQVICLDAPRMKELETTILYRVMAKLSLACDPCDPRKTRPTPRDLPGLFGSPETMHDRANTHSMVPWDAPVADMSMMQLWRAMAAAANVSTCASMGSDAVDFVRAAEQRIAALFSYTHTASVLDDPEYIEIAPGQSKQSVSDNPAAARLMTHTRFVYRAMGYLRPIMDTVYACHYLNTIGTARCANNIQRAVSDAIRASGDPQSTASTTWRTIVYNTLNDDALYEFLWIKLGVASWESRLRLGERERYMVRNGTHSVLAQQVISENRSSDTNCLYDIYERRALGVGLWNLYRKEMDREEAEEIRGEQVSAMGHDGSVESWRGMVQTPRGWPWMSLPNLVQRNVIAIRNVAPVDSTVRLEVDEITEKAYVIEKRTNRIVLGHRRNEVMRNRTQAIVSIDHHEVDRINLIVLDVRSTYNTDEAGLCLKQHTFHPPTRYKILSATSLEEDKESDEEPIDVRRDAPPWIADSVFRSACAERGIMLWAIARRMPALDMASRRDLRILYFGRRYFVTDGDVCVASTTDVVPALVAIAHAKEAAVAAVLDSIGEEIQRGVGHEERAACVKRARDAVSRVPDTLRHMAGIPRHKASATSLSEATHPHITLYDRFMSPEYWEGNGEDERDADSRSDDENNVDGQPDNSIIYI